MKEIKVIYKKASELKLSFGNPRYITKQAKDELKKSIETLGDFGVIVIDEYDQVICGNQRIECMQEMGIEIPILCKQLIDYTETEKKIINIRSNKNSGEFDEGVLNTWLEEIKIEIEDISLTGFEDVNYNNGIKEKEKIDIEKMTNLIIIGSLREEIYKELLIKLENKIKNNFNCLNSFAKWVIKNVK